jgi:transposase InsO family protein
MAYSNNPNLPRVRMEAVNLVRAGWSTVKVARHLGYSQGTIVKWRQRAPDSRKARIIPTRSSRPYHHPNELASELVARIIEIRKERNQCAEIIHHQLKKEDVAVSLSSIKRTLKRNHLTYPSKWKKWHQYPERPEPERPGILIQLDSMQEGVPQEHLHVYALIDVCSRWAHAEAAERISAQRSACFVREAQKQSLFQFATIQSDHGREFSKWFTKKILEKGMSHRHSRVRTPTDNAHVERFIQTLQKQCLYRVPRSLKSWQKEIPEFLRWYNYERPHMALDMKTPMETLKLFQAID